MLRNGENLLNAVNKSTQRLQRQGFQRRFSVTDLHGVQYTDIMSSSSPAQFYTAISYDLDRFSHWWFKIIIKPAKTIDVTTAGETSNSGGVNGWAGSSRYSGGDIKYGNYVLKKEYAQKLAELAKENEVLFSGLVAQLYLESMWGNSPVGRTDNNWGGHTWTGSGNRPSGIKVTQGSARPANEGGYYMHYASVDDYLYDYVYLLTKEKAGNNQRMYNVVGKQTFDEYVKGLFRAGGAVYDYAAAGYSAYLPSMKSIRDGINKANGNILDTMDKQILEGGNANIPVSTETTSPTTNTGSSIKASKVEATLKELRALKGRTLGSGECYGLVAWYSNKLGGPNLGGGITSSIDAKAGGGLYASYIGTDFNWASKGWKVKGSGISVSDLKVGAIVNIKPNNGAVPYTGIAGHTAVIAGISGNQLTILEQNYNNQRYVAINNYNANVYAKSLQSIVYPPEIAKGGVAGSASSLANASEIWTKIYDISDSGDGNLKPHTRRARHLIMELFGIKEAGGYRPDDDGQGTGHGAGLAVDFMVSAYGGSGDPDGKGEAIAQFLTQNMEALQISYIIWNQRFYMGETNTYGPANTWNPMPDRGSNTQNHKDHVHVSFKINGGNQPRNLELKGGPSISTSGTSELYVQEFAKDIKVTIDGIDFTPMFKAQFDGEWIDSFKVFPNDRPNSGYDVMLSASALSDNERKTIFATGEHVVEVSGSMIAEVSLRMYLKYNHLN